MKKKNEPKSVKETFARAYEREREEGETYCRAVRGVEISKGSRGPTVVVPTKTSCKKVLYFEIVVG